MATKFQTLWLTFVIGALVGAVGVVACTPAQVASDVAAERAYVQLACRDVVPFAQAVIDKAAEIAAKQAAIEAAAHDAGADR